MKPRILIVGPTPPPYIGPSVATKLILESELKNDYQIVHLETADRRSTTNIGIFDLRNIFLAFIHIFKLSAILITSSPHIVYIPICQTIVGYLRDTIFIILAKIFGARVIIHLRGGYFRKLYDTSNIFAQCIIKNSLKLVSKVIVLGESLRYIFDRLVPNQNIVVVPNGIDSNYITEEEFEKAQEVRMAKVRNDSMINKVTLSTKHYALSSRMRILFLSNLMKSKGFFDVIKAMSEVLQYTGDSELIVAGEFREQEKMKNDVMSYMDKSKLDSHVKFIGTVVGAQKRNLLLSTDIFVLPTYYRYEGQPWVIVEAMAAGLPIITTDHGCIKEMVIHGENGFLIEKQNPQQISEKIIALLKDDDLRNRMGTKSRERFLKHYTKDIFIRGLNSVFEDIYVHKLSAWVRGAHETDNSEL
ncbi:hypothetical protein AMJ52_05740 [candidate division TA06 bacterium DG_78]|uniref:Glycosyl transferase family 1 domain-containing protein n=1 Tax=candidate division TA06 bacterium DG_78 TaxID=1703772 RepID=A0A0S7YCX2_UNCT6|nr:MAG: hypothetical protein AMJ52_05740 [candidate division TA06 bacterium DG_78]